MNRRLHTIKPSFLRVSRNWDNFHLFSYLNEWHFELNTFSFTISQVHNSLRNSDAITSSCQINKIAIFLWILVQLRSNYDLKWSFDQTTEANAIAS